MVKTKIIATLGPVSKTEKIIRKMMLAGMDAARLNFSHGSHHDMLDKIKIVRALNSKYRRRIRILGDLQGHRIRIGELSTPVELKKRKAILLTQNDVKGNSETIPFDYRGSLSPIKQGYHIFIDDGNICLEVTGRIRNSLKAKVVVGGLLKAHKGINIPGARLDFGKLSLKDKGDIIFCAENKIDYIAQSFVRSARDVLEIKGMLRDYSFCHKVVAKIECREGIRNIDEIIKVSDGILIARGDMGVSLPIHEIPVIQKMIIRKCNKVKKFVITAT
ncbi:MAG: pyruvate kinase, partial [Candidatus Omnitrophica bacterium]|nr:pyruvate kinase [Candidatus Omnitrophota bacterium]